MEERVPADPRKYLTALAELIQADPSQLAEGTRQQALDVLANPDLDAQAAEDLIADLAEDDEQLAAMWDKAQQDEPDRLRRGDPFNPVPAGDGATHNWVCPVAGCPTIEPGLGWTPFKDLTHCQTHGALLTPVRVAG